MAFTGGAIPPALIQALQQQQQRQQPVQQPPVIATGPDRSQLVAQLLQRQQAQQPRSVGSIGEGLARLGSRLVDTAAGKSRIDEQVSAQQTQQQAIAQALQGAFAGEEGAAAQLAQVNPQLAIQLRAQQQTQAARGEAADVRQQGAELSQQNLIQQRETVAANRAEDVAFQRERFDATESFRERQLGAKQDELGRKAAAVAAKGEAAALAAETGKIPTGYKPAEDGGIEPIPGGPADPSNPNSPIAKEVRAAKTVQTDLLAKVTRYKAALEKHGTEFPLLGASGAAQKEVSSTYTDLLLSAKEYFNLGVLNGPDLVIMRQIIPDPTTFAGTFQSTSSFIDNLDNQFKTAILDKQTGLQNIYGKDVWGSEVGDTKKQRTVEEIMKEFGQ